MYLSCYILWYFVGINLVLYYDVSCYTVLGVICLMTVACTIYVILFLSEVELSWSMLLYGVLVGSVLFYFTT